MNSEQKSKKISIKEICVFGLLGALMYASKIILEFLPNVHLIGVFVVASTVVYRKKALYPIYIFVVLTGLLNGFGTWWVPYLYIWTVLWAVVMILPQKMKPLTQTIVYTLICAAHGFLYGVLYAPAQALLLGLDFKGTIAWIVAGLPWDAVHGVSNLICGAILVMPLVQLLKKLNKTMRLRF